MNFSITEGLADNYQIIQASAGGNNGSSASASLRTVWDFRDPNLTVFEFRDDVRTYSYCYASSDVGISIVSDTNSVTLQHLSTSVAAWN